MLIPLVKINIAADKDSKEKILDFLQEKGILEISEVKTDFFPSNEMKN